jgi:hypothetical protein
MYQQSIDKQQAAAAAATTTARPLCASCVCQTSDGFDGYDTKEGRGTDTDAGHRWLALIRPLDWE